MLILCKDKDTVRSPPVYRMLKRINKHKSKFENIKFNCFKITNPYAIKIEP